MLLQTGRWQHLEDLPWWPLGLSQLLQWNHDGAAPAAAAAAAFMTATLRNNQLNTHNEQKDDAAANSNSKIKTGSGGCLISCQRKDRGRWLAESPRVRWHSQIVCWWTTISGETETWRQKCLYLPLVANCTPLFFALLSILHVCPYLDWPMNV